MLSRQAGVRPTIDGYLWELGAHFRLFIWTEAPASSITGSETSPTPADLSADLRSAWRPGLLDFVATVSDDALVCNQSAKAWNDDAVELEPADPGHGQDAPVHHRAQRQPVSQRQLGISSLTVVTRTVAGGWTLETAIPAWVLGLDALAAGQEVPVHLRVGDDDTCGFPAQTHMLWRGTVTDAYQPAWGTLSLSSTVYNDFPQGPTPTPTATPTRTPTATRTTTVTPTPTASGCTQPPAGLVKWWPGDGTAENIVGPNDGTLIGDASFAGGLVDEAFSLDGDGDWVDLGNNPIYNFGSSDFTISLWAYWNTLAGEQILIEKWDDGPAFEGRRIGGAGRL